MAVEISMRDMLEAGAHFGHQTRRWNPKMKPYIYGAKNGIHVINLQKTYPLLKKAIEFISSVVARGDQVLFVGTKHQAREVITEEAQRAGMPFVTYRWLGGMLTNIATIRRSIQSIEELESLLAEGSVERLPKKEVLHLEKRRDKLLRNLEGMRSMSGLPKAMFIVDPMREHIAVTEARRLNIPTVAVVDTNCDPDEVDYPIPANDDAIKSIKLFVKAMADACLEGRESHQQALIAAHDKVQVGVAGEGDEQKVEVIVRGKGPRKPRRPAAAQAPAAETPAAQEPAGQTPDQDNQE
ncbi:MAG: 30S ribosomal protein S2 [Deltaproteobacteria bacterium]|nr:30S ribosomal protein S2 [Deltaproteobacteria bacterium]